MIDFKWHETNAKYWIQVTFDHPNHPTVEYYWSMDFIWRTYQFISVMTSIWKLCERKKVRDRKKEQVKCDNIKIEHSEAFLSIKFSEFPTLNYVHFRWKCAIKEIPMAWLHCTIVAIENGFNEFYLNCNRMG